MYLRDNRSLETKRREKFAQEFAFKSGGFGRNNSLTAKRMEKVCLPKTILRDAGGDYV